LLEAAFDAINPHAEEDWIVDSGASGHFLRNRTTFSNLDSTRKKFVTSAGGQSHCKEGHGVAKITLSNGKIKSIHDVQYVPRLYRNILFVGKTADLGHIALFDQSACFVISKEKPFRVVVKGTRMPGSDLYKLTQLARDLDFPQQVHALANPSTEASPKELFNDVVRQVRHYIEEGWREFHLQQCHAFSQVYLQGLEIR
jgi:hypothetical protein